MNSWTRWSLIMFPVPQFYVYISLLTDFYVSLMYNYLVKILTIFKNMWVPQRGHIGLLNKPPSNKNLHFVGKICQKGNFTYLYNVTIPVFLHSWLITKYNLELFVCGARISGYYSAGLILPTSVRLWKSMFISHCTPPQYCSTNTNARRDDPF